MVTISQDKLKDTLDLVLQWSHRTRATIHELYSFLAKLFNMVQCMSFACYFVNRMLDMLCRYPLVGSIGFQRDLNWFSTFLPKTNGISIINGNK